MVAVQCALNGWNVAKQQASTVDPIFTSIGLVALMGAQTAYASNEYLMKLKNAKQQARYGVEKWELTSRECAVCKDVFDSLRLNTTKQHHHCCSCGHIVCHACSTTEMYLDVTGKVKRVCDDCVLKGIPKKHINPFDVKRSDMIEKVQRKAEFDNEARDKNGNVMSPEDVRNAELAIATSQGMSKKNGQLVSQDVKDTLKSSKLSMSSDLTRLSDGVGSLADGVDFFSDDEDKDPVK